MNEIGCGILSLKRFSYLLQLLRSLERAKIDGIDFYLFQDGGLNPFSGKLRAARLQIKTSISIFEGSNLPNKEVVAQKYNVGIPVNAFDAAEYVFERHKIGVFLENDVVVSRDYFTLIREMLDKFGGVAKAGECPTGEEGVGKRERVSGSNWATTREVWKKTKPFLKDFVTAMRKTDYADESPIKLREKYGCPTQDCVRCIAFKMAGAKIWETNQPKVRIIGKSGFHGASSHLLEVTDEQIAVKVSL